MSRDSFTFKTQQFDPDLRAKWRDGGPGSEAPCSLSDCIAAQKFRNEKSPRPDPSAFAKHAARQRQHAQDLATREPRPEFTEHEAIARGRACLQRKGKLTPRGDEVYFPGSTFGSGAYYAQFVDHLLGADTSGASWDAEIGTYKAQKRTLREYLNLLGKIELSRAELEMLREMSFGTHYAGPGLGAFAERRAALALAMIMDHSTNTLIKDFFITGEAAKPIQTNSIPLQAASTSPTALGAGQAPEETMAIDLMIQLKTDDDACYQYVPLQLKAQSGPGDAEGIIKLPFTRDEKEQLIQLRPETEDCFSQRGQDHYLRVSRKIPKTSVVDRPLYLTQQPTEATIHERISRRQKPDLANEILSKVRELIDEGKVLEFDAPYAEVPYAQRVAQIIEKGYLTAMPNPAEDQPAIAAG